MKLLWWLINSKKPHSMHKLIFLHPECGTTNSFYLFLLSIPSYFFYFFIQQTFLEFKACSGWQHWVILHSECVYCMQCLILCSFPLLTLNTVSLFPKHLIAFSCWYWSRAVCSAHSFHGYNFQLGDQLHLRFAARVTLVAREQSPHGDILLSLSSTHLIFWRYPAATVLLSYLYPPPILSFGVTLQPWCYCPILILHPSYLFHGVTLHIRFYCPFVALHLSYLLALPYIHGVLVPSLPFTHCITCLSVTMHPKCNMSLGYHAPIM